MSSIETDVRPFEERDLRKYITEDEQTEIKTYEKIGAGACANLYKKDRLVYKILKENSKGLYKRGSLERLASADVKSSLCVFPKEVLKDQNGIDLGYTMDLVIGTKLKDIFQDISFGQLEQVLTDAEVGIKELSEQKIVFDDMHFNNMMWDEENESIRIIDTDFFKIAEEISTEEIEKSNHMKFNNQIETLIGLRDGVLSKYLGRNEEYTKFYKEYFKRGLKGEKLSPCELIKKIKSVAEKDFGTEFTTISQVIEKAKDKVKEYDDEELDFENWSEGNDNLRNLLRSCRDNNVPSMFCCAGHGKEKPAYITIQMNEQTNGKIYNIMNKMSNVKDISFRFAQKEFGQEPSFTVYMNNEQSKNEIMDIISLAMTEERSKEELPLNFQKFIDINNVFQSEDIGFDLQYNIGKRRNSLLLENLKFANSKWLEKPDFKNIGLKSREDMFGRVQYFRNGIRNEKDTQVLNDILVNLNKVYDINYDETIAKLTMQQKIAQKISSNRFLRKIPFIEKFIKEQLYMLPDATEKPKVISASDKRKSFIEELSKDIEPVKTYKKDLIELEKNKNTRTEKCINDDGR